MIVTAFLGVDGESMVVVACKSIVKAFERGLREKEKRGRGQT